MMRKGPLGRTTIDELLREAAGESLTGGLRIDAVPGGTVFLRNGYVCDVEVDGATLPLDLTSTNSPSKELVRRHFEIALSGLLDASHGWYHFDQYLHPPGDTPWVFHTTAMLEGVAERRARVEPVRRWGGQPLRVTRSPYRRFEVTADMWEIVVALSSRLTGYQVAEMVDWEPNRLAAVLRQMERAELLAPPPDLDADLEPPAAVTVTAPLPPTRTPVPTGAPVTAGVARTATPTAQPTGARPLPLDGSTVPWTPRSASAHDTATRTPVAPPAEQPREPRAGPHAGQPGQATSPVPAPPSKPNAQMPPPAGSRPTGRRSALKRLIGSLRT